MSLSPVRHSSPKVSTLTRILGGTAFLWQPEHSVPFDDWWETTEWAAKLRDNLAKERRSNHINPPRWDSKLRKAEYWAQFGQGAKIHSGEPFIFCLACNSALQHPSAFNVGTTHMRCHLNSGKCRTASGRKDQDISTLFGKVII